MNKQETIKKINDLDEVTIIVQTDDGPFGINYLRKQEVLELVEQLDEPAKPPKPELWAPDKPVVPQFVADWYEDNKYTFEYSIVKLIEDSSNNAIEDDDLRLWFGFDLDNDKPIETLVNMHQFGYKLFEVV